MEKFVKKCRKLDLDHVIPRDHQENCLPIYLEFWFYQFVMGPGKRRIFWQQCKHKRNEMICLIHLIVEVFQSVQQCNSPHLALAAEKIIKITRWIKIFIQHYTRLIYCPQIFLPPLFPLIFQSKYISLYTLSRPR